jgi:hypothetical protein
VPVVPFTSYSKGQNTVEDPFRAAEEKVRTIKNNIRIRLGEQPINSAVDHIDWGQLSL